MLRIQNVSGMDLTLSYLQVVPLGAFVASDHHHAIDVRLTTDAVKLRVLHVTIGQRQPLTTQHGLVADIAFAIRIVPVLVIITALTD